MPTTHPNTEKRSADFASGGPAAHEDLTIAEQLEIMRIPDEDRPGEPCFLTACGEKRRAGEREVEHFIHRHGAEFSSNYLLIHGSGWEDDLFGGLFIIPTNIQP